MRPPITLLALLLALLAPAAARAAEQTITFDDLAAGAVVTGQYAALGGPAQGPVFGQAPVGFSAEDLVVTAPGGGVPRSGANVGRIRGCSVEICSDFIAWARFPFLKQQVGVYLGGIGTRRLEAYSAGGTLLATDEHAVTATASTLFSITRPSAQIAYIAIYEDSSHAAPTVVDDLTYDVPATPPPADFGVAVDPSSGLAISGEIGLTPGKQTTVTLVVDRVNGSSGPITLSAGGLPPGVTATFAPSATISGTTATMTVKAANDVPTPVDSLTFTVTGTPGGPGAGTAPRSTSLKLSVFRTYDVRVTGIEVTQGIQGEVVPCMTPQACRTNISLPARSSAAPTAPVQYSGVSLVRQKRTVARVFANVRLPDGGTVAKVGALLAGFDAAGSPLPGSPISADQVDRTLVAGRGLAWTTFADRVNPAGAYTFTLPSSWTTRASIQLEARLLPPVSFIGTGDVECETAICAQNNVLRLKGIGFVRTGHLTIATAHLYAAGEDRFTPLPGTVMRDAELFIPLADGELRYDPSQPYQTIGIQQAIDDNPDDDKSAMTDAKDILEDAMDDYPGCSWADFCADAVLGYFSSAVTTRGVTTGTLSPFDGVFESAQPISVGNIGRPKSVAHELSHGMGRPHADLTCGGNSDGQSGESWPPDDQGRIQGVGVDIRPGSGAAGDPTAPYAIIAPGALGAPAGVPGGNAQPQQIFDYMSYCSNGDVERWMSSIGQNRMVTNLIAIADDHGRLAPVRARVVAPATRGAAARVLRVQAIVAGDGSVRITRVKVKPGPARPAPAPPGPYSLEVVTPAGSTIVAMRSDSGDAGEAVAPAIFLAGEAAAPTATTVRVRRNGVVVAERARSAHAPVVRVTAPRAGRRVSALDLRWTATDADAGDRLAAKVDFSADDGRTWSPLWVGPSTGRLRLPARAVPRAAKARLRVRVSDGFRETAAISARIRTTGAPPSVAILSPAPGERATDAATLLLTGQAYDDAHRRLRGARLVWRVGGRKVATGERASLIGLPAGASSVTLVARDRFGRTARRTVKLRVRRTRPVFTTVRAPVRIARSARRVTLRVASSIPARLAIGKRRFAVDRRVRRVVLSIARGQQPLVLKLTLRAGGRTTVARVRITRS